MAPPFPQPGEHFARQYRIVSEVGSGGFARIYHAVRADLRRDVALKILEPSPFEHLSEQQRREFQGQLTQRFQREARNVAQLRDPHTVTLYNYGRSSEGLMFMVFEYIDGEDLQFAASRGVTLEAERVAYILEQILLSLHEAHSLGFLHRDIKPANIMLYEHVGRPDCVKVLDFGIAKAVLADANLTLQDLTGEGIMLGTPRYMSPEQLRGEEIGPPSDLYSVGLVIYELLVGRKAITIDDTHQIINRQISREAITLPDDRHVPSGLKGIVERLLAKEPKARYQSAADVLDELEAQRPAKRRGGSLIPDSEPTEPTTAPFGSNPGPSTSETEPNALRWGPLVGALLAVIVVGLAGIAVYIAMDAEEDSNSQASAPSRPQREASRQTKAGGTPTPSPAEQSESTAETPKKTREPRRKTDDRADAIKTMRVKSTVSDADIWVNNQHFGTTPISISTDSVTFPATIKAVSTDGRDRRRTLEVPTDRILLRFEPAPEDAPTHAPDEGGSPPGRPPPPSSPDDNAGESGDSPGSTGSDYPALDQ